MDWAAIATIIGALGGLEFVKWLVNGKAYARKENASARDAELAVHEKQIDRYEQRLAQRDAKVDAIYRELREVQARELEHIKEINRLQFEVDLRELQKCEERGCDKRKPPSSY